MTSTTASRFPQDSCRHGVAGPCTGTGPLPGRYQVWTVFLPHPGPGLRMPNVTTGYLSVWMTLRGLGPRCRPTLGKAP